MRKQVNVKGKGWTCAGPKFQMWLWKSAYSETPMHLHNLIYMCASLHTNAGTMTMGSCSECI